MDFSATLARFAETVAAHDSPAFAALFTPDGVYDDYFFGPHHGRDAIAEMLDRFHVGGETFCWQFEEPARSGDLAYASYCFSYRSREPESAGKVIVFEGMSRFRLRNGLIAHYSAPERDFVFRMKPDWRLEDRLAFYRKRIYAHFDVPLSEEADRRFGAWKQENPRGKHAIGVGILNRLNLIIEGSTGYFSTGLIDGPNVRVKGRVGWSCGENMMSGTIVIENVFSLPGLGRLVFQAIANRDLALVRNVVMLLAASVIVINFVVDVLYAVVDPRLKVASA